MFPVLQAEAIDALASAEWPGNFRELEKVCADLFYDMDRDEGDYITLEMVTRTLSHRRFIGSTEEGRTLVRAIEDALRREKYRVTKAPQHLREFKIGDVATLKKRLQQYRDELSPEVRNHPKIVGILKRSMTVS